jgi:DNA polymerase III sliding clamp (beta) subunit (PCNA family)
MKQITIGKDGFNHIMTGLKGMVAKSETRQPLTQIKLEYAAGDDTITAVALDGYKLGKIVVPVWQVSTESFDAIVPVVNRTKGIAVTIKTDEKTISFDHFGFATETYPIVIGEYVDWKSIIPTYEFQYEISVNPEYLAAALLSFASADKHPKAVALKFGSHVNPIQIERGKDMFLVLPCRTD